MSPALPAGIPRICAPDGVVLSGSACTDFPDGGLEPNWVTELTVGATSGPILDPLLDPTSRVLQLLTPATGAATGRQAADVTYKLPLFGLPEDDACACFHYRFASTLGTNAAMQFTIGTFPFNNLVSISYNGVVPTFLVSWFAQGEPGSIDTGILVDNAPHTWRICFQRALSRITVQQDAGAVLSIPIVPYFDARAFYVTAQSFVSVATGVVPADLRLRSICTQWGPGA